MACAMASAMTVKPEQFSTNDKGNQLLSVGSGGRRLPPVPSEIQQLAAAGKNSSYSGTHSTRLCEGLSSAVRVETATHTSHSLINSRESPLLGIDSSCTTSTDSSKGAAEDRLLHSYKALNTAVDSKIQAVLSCFAPPVANGYQSVAHPQAKISLGEAGVTHLSYSSGSSSPSEGRARVPDLSEGRARVPDLCASEGGTQMPGRYAVEMYKHRTTPPAICTVASQLLVGCADSRSIQIAVEQPQQPLHLSLSQNLPQHAVADVTDGSRCGSASACASSPGPPSTGPGSSFDVDSSSAACDADEDTVSVSTDILLQTADDIVAADTLQSSDSDAAFEKAGRWESPTVQLCYAGSVAGSSCEAGGVVCHQPVQRPSVTSALVVSSEGSSRSPAIQTAARASVAASSDESYREPLEGCRLTGDRSRVSDNQRPADGRQSRDASSGSSGAYPRPTSAAKRSACATIGSGSGKLGAVTSGFRTSGTGQPRASATSTSYRSTESSSDASGGGSSSSCSSRQRGSLRGSSRSREPSARSPAQQKRAEASPGYAGRTSSTARRDEAAASGTFSAEPLRTALPESSSCVPDQASSFHRSDGGRFSLRSRTLVTAHALKASAAAMSEIPDGRLQTILAAKVSGLSRTSSTLRTSSSVERLEQEKAVWRRRKSYDPRKAVAAATAAAVGTAEPPAVGCRSKAINVGHVTPISLLQRTLSTHGQPAPKPSCEEAQHGKARPVVQHGGSSMLATAAALAAGDDEEEVLGTSREVEQANFKTSHEQEIAAASSALAVNLSLLSKPCPETANVGSPLAVRQENEAADCLGTFAVVLEAVQCSLPSSDPVTSLVHSTNDDVSSHTRHRDLFVETADLADFSVATERSAFRQHGFQTTANDVHQTSAASPGSVHRNIIAAGTRASLTGALNASVQLGASQAYEENDNDMPYNGIVIASIQRLSARLRSSSQRLVALLKDRLPATVGMASSETCSSGSHDRANTGNAGDTIVSALHDGLACSADLTSTLSSLRQVEHNIGTLERSLLLHHGSLSSILSSAASVDQSRYLAELRQLRSDITGFKPIEDSVSPGAGVAAAAPKNCGVPAAAAGFSSSQTFYTAVGTGTASKPAGSTTGPAVMPVAPVASRPSAAKTGSYPAALNGLGSRSSSNTYSSCYTSAKTAAAAAAAAAAAKKTFY